MCKETSSRYAKCRHKRVRRSPCDKELYNRAIRHTWRSYLPCIYPERRCTVTREKAQFKSECDRCLKKTADACVDARAAAQRYNWPAARRDSYIDPIVAEGLTCLAGAATGDDGLSLPQGTHPLPPPPPPQAAVTARGPRDAAGMRYNGPVRKLPNLKVRTGGPGPAELMDPGQVSPLSPSDMDAPRRPVSLLEEDM